MMAVNKKNRHVSSEHRTPGPAHPISSEAGADPLTFLGGLRSYGDVVRYQTRFGPCLFFARPEHVQTILHSENYHRASLVKMMLGDGLLASEGALWKSHRHLMQGQFLPRKVAPFAAIMTRETAHTARAWDAAAGTGEFLEVGADMTALTLRVVVEALFTVELGADRAAALCAAVTGTITELGKISWMLFGTPVQFTPARNADFVSARRVIDAFCHEMMAARRALPPEQWPADLLTLLLRAELDTGALSDEQVRDELVTLMVGGHETTALTLNWTWKLIAENPGVEAKLHEEVDAAMSDGRLECTDLSRLPWARAIIDETMRLYPPVWVMAKVAREDDVIDGHAIPRGACVIVSAWFTHRHKEFWPDPERFDPSRFVGGGEPAAHRYAYFPFGGGRHRCLGSHFALLEGALILAQLASRFRVRPLTGQEIRPVPGVTLRQAPGLCATLERRRALPAGAAA